MAEELGHEPQDFFRGFREAIEPAAPRRGRYPPVGKPALPGIAPRGERARARIALLASVATVDDDYSLANSHSRLGMEVIRAAALLQRAARRLTAAGETF